MDPPALADFPGDLDGHLQCIERSGFGSGRSHGRSQRRLIQFEKNAILPHLQFGPGQSNELVGLGQGYIRECKLTGV